MALGTQPEAADARDPAEDDGSSIFAEINITPLTDVILVLLIIVMLYASAATKESQRREERAVSAQRSGLKVNLPDGAAKDIEPGANSLVVGIMANGELYVNGQKIAEGDLDGVFQKNYAKDKETQVVIKADGDAAHRRVVGVMEKAKANGLRRIAIATKGQ